MKTQKITGEQIKDLETFQAARNKKNEGTREEKNARKVLEVNLPELRQKETEISFMFNGKPVATWTKGERNDIDRTKLQTEYPEVYKACYLPMAVWTLDVLM